MTKWYAVKAKFTKEFQDGTLKKVTEQYLVNAETFGNAEEVVYKEIGEMTRGEFIIIDIKPQEVADIFMYEDSEKMFDCRVSYTTESDSGKEKKVVNRFLVTAKDTTEATERVQDSLKGLMSVFEVVSVSASPICEVITKPETV